MTEKIQISGTVETILPTQDFPSGFRKRVLVVNTGGEYPQTIPVEFVKDKCDALDSLAIGQEVTAHVNIRGNEYNGKYYSSIQGWRFEAGEKTERSAPSQSKPEPRNMSIPSNRQADPVEEEEDDIPF